MRVTRGLVGRVVGVASRFQGLDLGQRLLVHWWHQHVLGLGVGRDACHHVGDDWVPEVLLMGQGVLDGQRPATYDCP